MALAQSPARPRDLKATTPDASKILQRIVYGWFMRVERGVYALTTVAESGTCQMASAFPQSRTGHQIRTSLHPRLGIR